MTRTLRGLMAMAILAALNQVGAQSLRDPTLPPYEAGVAGVPAMGSASRIEPGNTNVIVRDGRAYLVVGTRLYAQGEKLGQTRIERITETEVWLREAGELRKVPRFAGVERHALVAATGSGCAPTVAKQSSRAWAGKASRADRASGSGKTRKVAKKSNYQPASPLATPCVALRP